VGVEPTSLNHKLLARQFATIRSVRFYIMDANLESGVSQDTGPQSNELEQPASYLGRLRVRASAPERTLRQRRTASLNLRQASIQ
jgi:hypothetical protein